MNLLLVTIFFGLFAAQCSLSPEVLRSPGQKPSPGGSSKDDVHPLTEINFGIVADEHQGMKILEENATTVYDFYRGGVQEKREGEKELKEARWAQARSHFEKSNKYLRIVLNHIPEDEARRHIHGDETMIFLPNLLVADNYLKLMSIFRAMKFEGGFLEAKERGLAYLSRSLQKVKTEWAYQIKKGFEES